jgi:flagellar biogenesis protein FliO
MRDLAQKLSTSAPTEPEPARTPASPRPVAAPTPTAAGEAAALLPRTPVSSNEKLPLGRSETRTPATEGDQDKPAVNPMFGSGWVLNTVTALGLVIGLLLVVRLVLPKVAGQSGARSAGVIEVLSRVVVGPRSHVLLVRIGTRVLVLGDGPGGLRTLADIEDPDQVAHVLATVSMNKPTSVSAGFAQMVSAFNKDYREGGEPDEGADDAEVKVDRARDGVGTLLARVRHMSRGGGT